MWYTQTISLLISVICIFCFSLFLALLTVLITQCAQKEKWKKPVLAMQKLSIFLGILFFVVGIVAYLVKQDYHVWFPLVILGLFLILVMGLQLFVCTKAFHSHSKKVTTESDNDKKELSKESPKTKYQSIYNKKA